MAFYSGDEEEDELGQGGVATAGQSGVITGGAPGASASAGPGAPPAGAPDKSGSFVGIKQYLDANKPQAAKLGDQAASVIDNAANQARTDVVNLKSSFNQKVGSAPALDQSALGGIAEAEKLSGAQRSSLGAALKGQYTGPKDLMDTPLSSEFSQASKSLNKARENVVGSGTESGRGNVISQINQGPRTTGITQFDNTLLSAGGGRQKLAEAAARNEDVNTDMIGKANNAAAARARATKAQVDANRAQVGQALTGAQTGLKGSVDKKLQDAVAKALGANTAITEDITDFELSPETLQAYGLKSGDELYGANLADYLTQGDVTGINAKNIASPEDYARAAALAEITGETMQGFEDPSQAGTANLSPKIDSAKLREHINAGKSAFEKEKYDGFKSGQMGYNYDIPPMTPKEMQEIIANPALITSKFGVPAEFSSSQQHILSQIKKNWSDFQDKWKPGQVINKTPKSGDKPSKTPKESGSAPPGTTVMYKGGK